MPNKLAGGKPAPPSPSRLHLGRAIGTEERITSAASLLARKPLRACLRILGPLKVPGGAAVLVRTTVYGVTYTFRGPSQPMLYSCDLLRAGDKPCGAAAGMTRGGRLLDPRLHFCIGGRVPTAFLWVTPSARARWISVDQGAFNEVYPVASGWPVRVVLRHGIDEAAASVRFTVREYGAYGQKLAVRETTAKVAG